MSRSTTSTKTDNVRENGRVQSAFVKEECPGFDSFQVHTTLDVISCPALLLHCPPSLP